MYLSFDARMEKDCPPARASMRQALAPAPRGCLRGMHFLTPSATCGERPSSFASAELGRTVPAIVTYFMHMLVVLEDSDRGLSSLEVLARDADHNYYDQ